MTAPGALAATGAGVGVALVVAAGLLLTGVGMRLAVARRNRRLDADGMTAA